MSTGPSLNIRSVQENQAAALNEFKDWYPLPAAAPAGIIHRKILVPYQIRRHIWAAGSAWHETGSAWYLNAVLRFKLKDVVQFELPVLNMSIGNTMPGMDFSMSIFFNLAPRVFGTTWASAGPSAGQQPPLVALRNASPTSMITIPCVSVDVRADSVEYVVIQASVGTGNILTGFAILSMQ